MASRFYWPKIRESASAGECDTGSIAGVTKPDFLGAKERSKTIQCHFCAFVGGEVFDSMGRICKGRRGGGSAVHVLAGSWNGISDYPSHHRSGLCWAQVGDERISFSLRERNRRTKLEPDQAKKSWRAWKDEPSGLLVFSMDAPWGFGHPTVWHDGKRQKIEEKLAQIVWTLHLIHDYKRNEKIRQQQEAGRRHLEERRRARIAQQRDRMNEQRKREGAALDKAIQAAQSWQTAGLLRRYAIAMENKLGTDDVALDTGSPAMLYLQWLRLRADLMDLFSKANEVHPNLLARDVPGI